MNTRTTARIVSFIIAGFVALGGAAILNYNTSMQYKLQVENSYQRAVRDLSTYVSNISKTLQKVRYAGTANQLTNLSTQLYREASAAKSCLSQLPVADLHLDNTNKFLSQVGDYAMSTSRQASSTRKISDEERKNFQTLYEFSTKLNSQFEVLEQNIDDGTIRLGEVKAVMNSLVGDQNSASGVTSGFKDMEEGFTGYPTLIYDGPFSDHILEREPLMTKDQKEIGREEARKKAALSAGVEIGSLRDGTDENSRMPSYCFEADSLNVSVTKNGGFTCYMVNSRVIEEKKLDAKACIEKAEEYLKQRGIKGLRKTYYEIANGKCVINYAAEQDGVLLYPDLVKVGVAVDNGQIVFFDARGYLTNHKTRELKTPVVSEADAKKSLSPNLTVQSVQRTVIPTTGLNEVETYEFLCTGDNDEQVLVYVNTQNAQEEQILILIESENGTLTI
ncbi:germination protein YpeB [Candidatus Soleaferrea massiliensis]|uniref:germination protein YpeB n=1 Tax=Candidatus Soleaferrea massiliensis TaxID=1470354 RepID=UPI0006943559|nr:germination protein YpeB [Candidatus Soleaferrea massiliensis]